MNSAATVTCGVDMARASRIQAGVELPVVAAPAPFVPSRSDRNLAAFVEEMDCAAVKANDRYATALPNATVGSC